MRRLQLASALCLCAFAGTQTACSKPCSGHRECPTGELCSAYGACVPDPNPDLVIDPPVSCEEPLNRSIFVDDNAGSLSDAEHYACPRPFALDTDGVRVSGLDTLDGNRVTISGGNLSFVVTPSRQYDGARYIFGFDGDGYFTKRASDFARTQQENPLPLQLDLFMGTDVRSTTLTFFVGFDDGTGSVNAPHIVNYAEMPVEVLGVQSGDIQVSVRWDNNNDVDLHVFDPNGVHVFYANRNPTDSSGSLDLDSNVGCVEGPQAENIFWPTGTAIPGQYRVELNLFSTGTGTAPACEPTPHYDVTVSKNLQFVGLFSGDFTASEPAGTTHIITTITYP